MGPELLLLELLCVGGLRVVVGRCVVVVSLWAVSAAVGASMTWVVAACWFLTYKPTPRPAV